MAFTEKTVVAELNEIEEYELQAKNREHFKGKVVSELEKGKEKALETVESRASNRTSNFSVEFNLEEFLEGLEEDADAVAAYWTKLTTVGVSTKPELDTTFMDKLYPDTETSNKTMTDLNKLVDSFL